MVCGKVKDVIASQISSEEVEEWRNRAVAYFREKEITVFEEKVQEEKRVYRPDTEP